MRRSRNPIVKDLVLTGGGHSHVAVLKGMVPPRERSPDAHLARQAYVLITSLIVSVSDLAGQRLRQRTACADAPA